MTKKSKLHLITILLLFLFGCNLDTTNGEPKNITGEDLLLSLNDLLSGWEARDLVINPNEEHPVEWRISYYLPPHQFEGRIVSYVLMADEALTLDYFEGYYQGNGRYAEAAFNEANVVPSTLLPPNQYHYVSPVAQQFHLLYYPESSGGPFYGYRYEAHGWCGRIAYGLSAVIDHPGDPFTVDDAPYLLAWSQLKALLEAMDKKTEQTC